MFCVQRLKYIALFLLLALIIFGCVKEPDDPVFDNPFDPQNPKTNGEPYHLQVAVGNKNVVNLKWNKIDNVKNFSVYRCSSLDNEYKVIGISTSTEYVDSNIDANVTYNYKICAHWNGTEASPSGIVSITPLIIYTITVTAESDGNISPSGNIKVAHGLSQSFNIYPHVGYSILDVKIDGVSKGNISSYTFSNVTTDHTIKASFSTNTANKPPVAPYQPQPKENETVSANVRLTWNCYDPDGDPVLYDIYINGSLIVSSVSNQFYEAELKNGLTYEWFIVAKDNKGNKTDGPKWIFNTNPLIYIINSVTVEASNYLSWTMILSKGDKLRVAITSDRTIDVLLVSELEFDHFAKNEDFNFIREGSSNQIINFNFDFVVPESGGYRLVLDNRAAWFFSKNVFVLVYWSHYN